MPGKRASPRRTQQVGCLGLWPGEHHERLLGFCLSTEEKGGLGQTGRTVLLSRGHPLNSRNPERARSPTTGHSQGSGPDDLSIDPTDHAVPQPWSPPPFSARKRLPPSAPLVGDGQSAATGKFRSRSADEQSERGAGDRDKTLSCSCPARRAKTSFPGREAAPPRLAASFPPVQKGSWAGLRSASASAVTLCWRGAIPPSWLARPPQQRHCLPAHATGREGGPRSEERRVGKEGRSRWS